MQTEAKLVFYKEVGGSQMNPLPDNTEFVHLLSTYNMQSLKLFSIDLL